MRLDIAGQRQDHLVSPRIAAEVEIRRHVRCEVLASCGSPSAGRIERENAKTAGIARALRTRAAQVADIGDGAAAFEQGRSTSTRRSTFACGCPARAGVPPVIACLAIWPAP
jgi:hypothetical protein